MSSVARWAQDQHLNSKCFLTPFSQVYRSEMMSGIIMFYVQQGCECLQTTAHCIGVKHPHLELHGVPRSIFPNIVFRKY